VRLASQHPCRMILHTRHGGKLNTFASSTVPAAGKKVCPYLLCLWGYKATHDNGATHKTGTKDGNPHQHGDNNADGGADGQTGGRKTARQAVRWASGQTDKAARTRTDGPPKRRGSDTQQKVDILYTTTHQEQRKPEETPHRFRREGVYGGYTLVTAGLPRFAIFGGS